MIFLRSLEDTLKFGRFMAQKCRSNRVLALYGDLGAGKTTFVQGLARGLGIEDAIQSPTFVFVNIYEAEISLVHFDLYRMKSADDFVDLGFEEFFSPSNICAIEWPQKIIHLLPKETVHLRFSYDGSFRKVEVEGLKSVDLNKEFETFKEGISENGSVK